MTDRFPNTVLYSLVVLILLTEMVTPLRSEPPQPFTIVAIPDTQNYVRKGYGDLFEEKVQWIVENVNALNIAFVTHEGDIVQNGFGNLKSQQWQRADEILAMLDSAVPYSVCLGDHDYNFKELPFTGTSHFVHYFGSHRYIGQPWYGGASQSETSHYQFFRAGGRMFLHLNLECDVPGKNTTHDQAAWAQSIIDRYPGMPTIVSTHSYVTDARKLLSHSFVGRTERPELWGGTRRSGEEIWNDLIRHNSQIFMVLNGNEHLGPAYNNGEYHQVSYSETAQPVIEVLSNYQGYQRGGDGWLRLITFDESMSQIRFHAYSPTRGQFRRENAGTPRASEFVLALDFNHRLGPRQMLPIASVSAKPNVE